MKSAQKTKLKKLIVAVESSFARTIGEPQMYLMLAFRWPRPASSTGGSCGWIERIVSAETTNENASTTSASGAENTCTSSPPKLGPATNEKARLPFSRELASR